MSAFERALAGNFTGQRTMNALVDGRDQPGTGRSADRQIVAKDPLQAWAISTKAPCSLCGNATATQLQRRGKGMYHATCPGCATKV